MAKKIEGEKEFLENGIFYCKNMDFLRIFTTNPKRQFIFELSV